MKNFYQLKPEDFPIGEPVVKEKNGSWYRANNSGYTGDLSNIGLYDRDNAIKYCFDDKVKNGCYGVIAVPIRLAIKNCGYKSIDIKRKIETLQAILPYCEESEISEMTVF